MVTTYEKDFLLHRWLISFLQYYMSIYSCIGETNKLHIFIFAGQLFTLKSSHGFLSNILLLLFITDHSSVVASLYQKSCFDLISRRKHLSVILASYFLMSLRIYQMLLLSTVLELCIIRFSLSLCLCVCVCVREIERERERDLQQESTIVTERKRRSIIAPQSCDRKERGPTTSTKGFRMKMVFGMAWS